MDDKNWHKVAGIVRDAGGRIVGRTRLQKTAYLLQLAGFGSGFAFEYRHYGPYSEDLADAIRVADAFDLVREERKRADWGGVYSIFTATEHAGRRTEGPHTAFAERVASIDAVELELAATAAYLTVAEKCADPWGETAKRKPEKIGDGRLDRAKEVYKRLLEIKTPTPLPKIV